MCVCVCVCSVWGEDVVTSVVSCNFTVRSFPQWKPDVTKLLIATNIEDKICIQ